MLAILSNLFSSCYSRSARDDHGDNLPRAAPQFLSAQSTRSAIQSASGERNDPNHSRIAAQYRQPASMSRIGAEGSKSRVIFSSPLSRLKDTVFDLTPYATPCRYRLLDCGAFTQYQELKLLELADFPTVPFTAISYTWRGNDTSTDDPSAPTYWKDELGIFQVKGSEDGDPISFDVLHHACLLAQNSSAPFLWLDRLCILQTRKPDKIWQIRQMYTIYKDCALCCILPGGIRRLVRIEEETSWIHRGWTLQEAVAPKETTVLFAWPYTRRSDENISILGNFSIAELVSGQSAQLELRTMLEASMSSIRMWIGDAEIPIDINLFGKRPYSAAPLLGALPAPVMFSSSNNDPNLRAQSIWQSALLRTSSRPVDMVFSIMGIFGVSLNPAEFHKNDRLGATIALAREIVKQDQYARWIGAVYLLDPSPVLSTFPPFPETSVAGRPTITLSDGSRKDFADLVSAKVHMDEYLEDIPRALSMDERGYLTLLAHAVRAIPVEQSALPADRSVGWATEYVVDEGSNERLASVVIRSEDESMWELRFLPNHDHSPTQPPRPITYLVYIGTRTQSTSGAFARAIDLRSLRAWLVTEHSPGRFHRVGYAALHYSLEDNIKALDLMSLSIGGPLPPTSSP